MKLLLFCLLLFWSAALNAGYAPYAEARAEAERMIYKCLKATEALDRTYSAQPEYLQSRNWVIGKLENMAVIDQLIRRIVVENTLSQNWPPSVKRGFLEYFFNFREQNPPPERMGFLQLQDYYNYKYFRYILENNRELKEWGWPIRSLYGDDADYYAFIIVQHGYSFDKEWINNKLLPRLTYLSEQGETADIVPRWLNNPELDKLDAVIAHLEANGSFWAMMVPEAKRMQKFFERVPSILKAPEIPPLKPQA